MTSILGNAFKSVVYKIAPFCSRPKSVNFIHIYDNQLYEIKYLKL